MGWEWRVVVLESTEKPRGNWHVGQTPVCRKWEILGNLVITGWVIFEGRGERVVAFSSKVDRDSVADPANRALPQEYHSS